MVNNYKVGIILTGNVTLSKIIRGKVFPDNIIDDQVIGTMEAKVILHHASLHKHEKSQWKIEISKREIQSEFFQMV